MIVKINTRIPTLSGPKPLAYKMWGYFVLFSVLLMILLWILQIIFLQTFYESLKIREVNNLGKEIIKNYTSYASENLDEFVNTVSFERGVWMYIVDEEGFVLSGNNRFARNRNDVNHRRKINLNFDKTGKAYVANSDFMRIRAVSYFEKIPGATNEYLYITIPVERVDTTTKVLQDLLIIVMILSLLISFVLAYYFSKRLSRPISEITKSAKILGDGNYKVKFTNGSYKEVNELSSVLNSAAAALSKSDELRRDLMANVSHDLRTPLTIIRSYAEMIRDISGADDTKRTAHANVIVDEANRLSSFVSDILDLSKLEAEESIFDFKKFSLTQAAEVTLESFKTFLDEGYHFFIDIDEGLYVCGDFQKLKSVIYNLVINSINYTGEDKTVYISLKKDGSDAVFSVTDSGEGIPEDEINNVWQRYYRSSSGHKRDKNGSGLGLSIVKMILTEHNCEFGVDSVIGEGSTFWFKIKLL